MTWLFSLALLQLSGQDKIIHLSLEQSCKSGISENAKIRHAALEQKKAGYRIMETKSQLYPQLEAYSNFSYYYAIPKMIIPGEIFGQTGLIPVEIGTKYDWTSGFRATQMLFNQSYFTALKLSRQLETLSTLTLQQTKEEIVYQITQLYYLCQATRDQITLLEARKKNIDQLLVLAELQNENELIPKSDLSRVSMTGDNLQTQIDNLEQLYYTQAGMLKYLIGMPAETEIILSDPFVFSEDRELRDLFTKSFSDRTELRIMDQQIEQVRLNRTLTRQSYLPTVSGFGQLYYQGQRNEFDFFKNAKDKFYKVGVVGVQLTIPLFDGFEKKAKLKQYDLELKQLNHARQDRIHYFSKELLDALAQYKNGLTIMSRQEKNVEIADDIFQSSLLGYKQQIVTLSDLLMSENELTEAHLSYSNALMQLKNAELELKKVKGELLDFTGNN